MARVPSNMATFFTQALQRFEASGSTFRVLCSLTSSSSSQLPPETETEAEATPPSRPPKYILVLDSSFNPPTLAHHRMVISALSDPRYQHPHPHQSQQHLHQQTRNKTETETKTPASDGGVYEQGSSRRGETRPAQPSSSSSSRVLLLLAINNADKAPKPASFPQRLAMMYAFARGILAESKGRRGCGGRDRDGAPASALEGSENECESECESKIENESENENERGICEAVDIAVTTEPYFHAKAQAIATSDFYRGVQRSEEPESAVSVDDAVESEQVYLTGYDTLIRIFNPKYYPGNSMKASLDPFFAHAGLRVTMRTDDSWGNAAEQIAYLDELRAGKIEDVGGRVEWVDKIELVQGRKEDEAIISSTKVRDAAWRQDWEALGGLVGEDVVSWIRENNLYVSDDR